jgi:hypothetical protein
MKKALLMAVGAVLVGAALAFAQYSFNNFNKTLGVKNAEITKSLTLYVDSLGPATQTVVAFKCQRAIKLQAGCITTTSVFVADTSVAAGRGECILRSTALSFTLYMDSNMTLTYTDPTDVTIPALTPCTLFIADDITGGTDHDGTGGFDAKVTLWYTDN